MDISILAQSVVDSLAPFLPYLLKASEKAAEEAGKKLGGESWNKAKALWGKLRKQVESKPAMLDAAQDVANSPLDEDALTVLRYQIKKLIGTDSSLASELLRIIEKGDISTNINMGGQRSLGIGGAAIGNVIITGDSNVIGNHNVLNVGQRTAPLNNASLNEFSALLSQILDRLQGGDINDEMRDFIDENIKVITAETKAEKPSLLLIESKLRGIESSVQGASHIGASTAALMPLINRAFEYAYVLFK